MAGWKESGPQSRQCGQVAPPKAPFAWSYCSTVSTKRSGRSGGAGTAAGIGFQDRLAAQLACAILAEEHAPPFWDWPEDQPLQAIQLETGEHVTLAGAIVAYTDSTHGVDTGSTEIVVRNIASGRTLLIVPGAGSFIDACVIRFQEVTDLVVTRRGSIAWLVRKGAGCKTTAFAVYSAQASGAPALLEEGPAIVPGSLRLSHGAVSWENAGQRKSARLR